MGENRTVAFEGDWHALERHTLLKMLLNQHSTLVMGRLGRYESSIMTWVSPTNGKLVDRAARYIRHLLSDRGVDRSYEDVVVELFRQRALADTNESVVMKVVDSVAPPRL
jgi:N-acetylmuramic acid 6-phosphate etherase